MCAREANVTTANLQSNDELTIHGCYQVSNLEAFAPTGTICTKSAANRSIASQLSSPTLPDESSTKMKSIGS